MKTLLSLIIVLTTQFVSAQHSEITWMKGTWTGSGYQPNSSGAKNWNIVLSYSEKEDIFYINYPSLQCGGTWELVTHNDRVAEFVETITEGKDKCTDKIIVGIDKLSSKKLKVNFYQPNSTILDAYGKLRLKK